MTVGTLGTVPSTLAGTWTLHLTSSMGVRTTEVKAPAKAPVNHKAGKGRTRSREQYPEAYTASRPRRSKRKRLLVSAAAPKRGALIPR